MIANEKNNFAISIEEAGKAIENICAVYLEKDKEGNYVIPVNKQRPVMMIGPAGIGKTDIPRQAAEKLGIGFLSYSITHHTRQSMLGLPRIVERSYAGGNTLTTEYTASEIITAIRDEIEKSGYTSGILFIDEVNCASETLSAPLLQLFQNKTLGCSKIPDGWILVMAGNPAEYNKSVKEFDAVTRDRLRVIDVRPDAEAWLRYAESRGLNEIITSFISSAPEKLHSFSSETNGIVTPRGWEELSLNMDSYLRRGYAVTGDLVAQFVGVPHIASEFYNYYKLVSEVISEKDIDNILNGKLDDAGFKKISESKQSVRFMLIACLKRKLHAASAAGDLAKAEAMLGNIIAFIKKAYGDGGEHEIFMSRILADAEIVKMTLKTHNPDFTKYLNSVANAEADIKKRMKKMAV